MEEKERYTIASFEIEEPSVIFDNKTQQIILTLVDYNYDEITHLKDLLNHYFKRIKELEDLVIEYKNKLYRRLDQVDNLIKENQQLKQQLAESKEENKKLVKALNGDIFINYKVPMENAKLKQQLHDLPKKIVEDIKIQMGSIEDILINCGNGKEDALCWLNRVLETTLKKYGGEDE